MSVSSPRICASSIAAFLLAAGLSSTGSAQITTWTGATDALWDTVGNWSLGAEPLATNDVVFPAPIPLSGPTITLTAGEVANSLEFQNAYTLTGGDLTLTTGNVTVAPTFSPTINSTLAGALGLNKLGTGTLTLGGTNTYSGVTSISSGILTFSASANLGSAAATNTLAISNNAMLRFTGATAADLGVNRSLAIGAGGATIDQTGAGTLTLSGAITSPAGATLTKSGSGTLILIPAANANNSLLGDITVDAGSLQLGTVAATQYVGALGGNVAGRTITVNSGALVNFIGRDTAPALASWVINGGTVRSTSGFNRLGPVTLNGGTINVIIGNSATFQAFSLESNVTVTGSAPSFISGTGTNGNIHLEPAAGVTFEVADVTSSSAADLSVTSILMNNTGTAAARALTKTGDGTLFLNANNAYTGNTNINQGTVDLGASGQIDGPTIVASGATLRISGGTDALSGNLAVTVNSGGIWEYNSTTETLGALTGGGTITRTVTGAGTLTVTNGSETSTFSGIIENGSGGGTLGLTKAGNAVFTLTGANTYTGTTFMNNGTLAVNGAAGTIQGSATVNVGDNNGGGETLSIGAAADVWASGTLNRLGDTAAITLNGGGTFNYTGPATGSSGNLETTGAITISNGRNNLTLTPGTGNDVQLSGAALTRANSGTALIRGDSLGGSGAGSTRYLPSSVALTGAGGADGSTNKSIVNFAVGDNSSTGGGSGFLTYDATNGLRVLTAGEYDGTIAGTPTLRNVSTAGGETVLADVAINSLRLTGTGTTTISAGNRVSVAGNAVLFTGAATLAGGGLLDFGSTEGIVSVANNTTTNAQIDARLGGTGGFTFSSTGSGTNTITLNGENTFIGNLLINSGILRAGSSAALNDNYPVTVLGRATSTFQANGNNVTVRDLQSTTGTIGFQNGAATPATLTTYLTAGRTLQTVLANGGTGALNVVLSGGQTLTHDQDSSATGSFEVRTGTLALSGTGGTINDFTSVLVSGGGTLRLTNTSTANNTNRVGSVPITLAAGTIDFDNNASALSFSETLGALTLGPGSNFIAVDKAGTGQTSVLTFTVAPTRNPGGLLVANSQNNGTAIFDLGTTSQSRLVFTGAPTLDDGIIGGYAVVQTSATSREFAKYVSTGTISLTALATADYTAALSPGANPTQNVRLTATPAALTADTQINSLTLNQASATVVDIGVGNTLRVESGGIAVNNAFNGSFINGTLTAGTGANTAGELVIHAVSAVANPAVVDSVIADNGTGVVTLTKGGGGVLDLQGVTNTYSGKTFLSGGTLRIDGDANLGTAPAAPSVGHLTTSANGILDVTQTMTLDANRGIALGGGTTVISVAAGTAGNGKILTYNGAISTVAGVNEAGLTFQSNATTTNLDTGEISATLTAPIAIGGPLRIEAGSVTTGAGDNIIGRSLQVGLNGTATFTQTSGTLKVGAGINDTFDIGVSGSDTVNKVGTLNLAGVSNLTANVDLVRIGVVTGGTVSAAQGVATFATNNDITAGTSIVVGDSGAAGLATQTVTFGTGTHNVTTQLMTWGGRKATTNLTLGTGGTLNLQGFGQRTLDLFIGRQNVDTGGVNLSTFNTSPGTLIASFDALTVGLKSGAGTLSGGVDASLTLGPSTANLVEANTLDLGNRSQFTGTAIGNSRAVGTLNMAGGAFTVFNGVALGTLADNGSAKGVLNLTGGTFTVGGDITKTDNDRSSGIINVAGGTLDLQNQAAGDTTAGTVTASQLTFSSGSIVDAAGITLDGRGVTDGLTVAPLDDALIVRDVNVGFGVNLTNATAGKGGIRYDATGGGTGATLGALNLGTVVRGFNIEDSLAAGADLVVSGSISGTLGGINKTGAGTLALGVANSYTGGTTLTDGRLIAAANGTLGGGNVDVLGTAISLSIGTGVTNAIADSATLSLAGGGIAALADVGFAILNTGVNETVFALFLNGAAQGEGTYGSTASTATFKSDEFFSGTGIVTVAVPEPGALVSLLGGLGSLFGLQRLRRRR